MEAMSVRKVAFPRYAEYNCAFRYILFQQHNCVEQYFTEMNQLGTHSGLIGLGEHYMKQHTNQTMSCVVFE